MTMTVSVSDLTAMRFHFHERDEFLEDAVSRGLGDLPHFWAYPGSDSVLAACGSVFVVDDTNLIAATDDDPSKGFLTLRVHDDMPDYRELLETHPHVFALSMDRLKEVHDEHGMTFDLVDWLKANVGPTAAFGKHQSDDAVVFDVGAGALASVRHGKRAIMVVTDCHAPMLTQKTSDFLEHVAKVYFFKDKAKAALFSTFWS
uniref:Uncharacterized protein n=1 Tax=viral metagenome TaxID=1070528 RepID=A0A6M3XQI9_9ZZZZ